MTEFDPVRDRVTEALELRYGTADDPEGPVGLPPVESGLDVVLASLLRVRKRLDRVEELLSTLIRVRGRYRVSAEVIEAQYQQAWDDALTSDPRLQAREFVAPREKYAHADLAAFTQKRTLLKAKDSLAQIEDGVEQVRLAHKGLDSLRYDHVVLIRAATVMSSLEG